MQYVMLSEFSNSSPLTHPPQGSLLCVCIPPAPTCTGWKCGGQVPLQFPESRPAAQVQIASHGGGGSSSPPPLSPGPGEMPAKPSCSPRRRMARAGCGCSCRGSLWVDGNGESFTSPHCRGEGTGRGRPRKFSFCHHRTKIRMSTTSKMMKRTTIAHHCRRSLVM